MQIELSISNLFAKQEMKIFKRIQIDHTPKRHTKRLRNET